jgi:GNAT superfamily N-acetyltransferase
VSDGAPHPIELIDLRTDVPDVTERHALCHEFFETVYRHAFLKPDQTETPAVWLPLLDHDQPPPAPLLHLIVASRRDTPEDRGVVVGGIVVEYFRRSRTALATYLAVRPDERHHGLARRLLADATQRVSKDNGGTRPLIFAEVERPEAQSGEAAQRSALGRLAIIAALGGRKVDLDYIQPRLGAHQAALDDLMLVLLAPEGEVRNTIPTATVRAFLEEFFSSLGQRDTVEFERVLGSMAAERIPLKDLSHP